MSTKLWSVRSALVDLFSEACGVPVYNGPVAKTTQPKECILVGTDGGETGTGEQSGEGAEVRQEHTELGLTGQRDENGQIVCAVWVWSGGADMSPLHETAAGLLDLISAALANDEQLGEVLKPGGWARFDGFTSREWQHDNGPAFRARFTVTYSAYIRS